MSRADVIRLAREAGAVVEDGLAPVFYDHAQLERFADLLTADARAARIAAQTENEALKARLAASGVAERRAVREAVLAERGWCAAACEDVNYPLHESAGGAIAACAAAIRARGAA